MTINSIVKKAVPILGYHGIGSADGWMKELFVSKETFETHLQYLQVTMAIKWYQ